MNKLEKIWKLTGLYKKYESYNIWKTSVLLLCYRCCFTNLSTEPRTCFQMSLFHWCFHHTYLVEILLYRCLCWAHKVHYPASNLTIWMPEVSIAECHYMDTFSKVLPPLCPFPGQSSHKQCRSTSTPVDS